MSDRYRRIYATVRAIPYGRVASYGQIAALAGLPRQARLVGYALHRLEDGATVPWHRVLNAQGRIAFPPHSTPYQRQQALLQAEGIAVIGGKVDLRQYRWQPSLDELLWGPGEA